ncbi:latrophilin-like protein 1 [Crassostrea virginica]
MCIVKEEIPGIHFTGEAKTEIRIKQKPTIVIKPIRSSVTKEDSVNITCYVSNKSEAYLRNNTAINICFANNTNVPGCSGIDSYNVTCTLTVVTNISFICGIGNCTLSNQMSTFTVVNKGSKLCSSEADWPPTLEGNEANIPCPDGYSGLEARKCKTDGSWATEINRDGCKLKELEQLENILNTATEISATVVDSSLSSLSNIVNNSNMASKNAGVFHNDIVQSVAIISQIASKNVTFSDHETANKTTQVFMGIVSTLLETGKTDVKAASKSKEKEVTSKILASIDNFAKSVTGALQVNQSVIVRKPNMLVSIEKVPKGTDINFPKEDNSDSATRFKLPQKALESLSEKTVSFTAVKYDNLGAEFISKNNTSIDSSVLSLTVDNLNSNNLQGNISLTFHRKNESRRPPECVFLSRSQDRISAWNTSGCSVENFTNSQVICSCNHLTNFAILLSLPDEVDIKALTGHFKALTLITFIGCGLSILGALITIFIYLYFWRYLKSRRSVLVVNLCFALFIAYMLFLTAVEQTNDKVGCAVIAALLHYFFLAMFCIMLALGIDLAVAVLDVFNSRSSSAFLFLLSWGLPAAIVGITLGTTKTSGYGDESYCWLRNNTLFGFIGPALGIILANLIVIIIVMRTIYSSAFMMKKSIKEKAKSGLRSICSLLPILGLTWVFGVLSIGEATIIFQYLFAICNSLQGLFIFLFHVVLNTQVRQVVSRKIKEYESKTLSTTSMSRRKLVSSKEMLKSSQSFEEFEKNGSRTESTSFIIPRVNASVSRRPTVFSS